MFWNLWPNQFKNIYRCFGRNYEEDRTLVRNVGTGKTRPVNLFVWKRQERPKCLMKSYWNGAVLGVCVCVCVCVLSRRVLGEDIKKDVRDGTV